MQKHRKLFIFLIISFHVLVSQVFSEEILWESEKVSLRVFNGEEARKYWRQIASLRIEMFKEFPYLYEGAFEYEKEYLETYFKSKNSRILLAFDKEEVIGFSNNIPVFEELEEIQRAFQEQQINPEKYLYIGEVMIKPLYRGQGLLRKFLEYHENFAAKYAYDHLVFMTVKRPAHHPYKPENYRSLEPIWEHFGYHQHPDLDIRIRWKQIDSSQDEDNHLAVWCKSVGKKMTDFYLWRHGETQANKIGLLSGGAPELSVAVASWAAMTALSEEGKEQAKKLGEMVVNQCALDVIYTSDLARAYDTAAMVARAYEKRGCSIPLRKNMQLREILHGEYELTSAEIRNKRGPQVLTALLEKVTGLPTQDRFLAWQVHPLVPAEGVVDGPCVMDHVVDVERYVASRETRPETTWLLFHRVMRELKKIAEENVGKKVGISTHGAVISTLLQGLDPEFEGTCLPPHYNGREIRVGDKVIPRAIQVGNCALFHIQYDHSSQELTVR